MEVCCSEFKEKTEQEKVIKDFKNRWSISDDGKYAVVEIKYCPWCGKELEDK